MSEKLRIVALGGGTGMKALLSGLHKHDVDVCAVITVADDGGSSGRLRRDFDIPPPGDIRNCLVSMSDADPLIGELFQYRFEDSILRGHNFGNLFLAVLTRLSGDFRTAIERARTLLSVRGNVIPSTDRKVVLVAEHPDGTKSTGEQAISHSGRTISRISLVPIPPPVSAEIEDYLASADVICLGPGSLYTSILPNLLVPGMTEAVNRSQASVAYIANLMTQPGETDGFDLRAHVTTLTSAGNGLRIDSVIARFDDGPQIAGIPLRRLPIISDESNVRHSPDRLAAAVLDVALAHRSRGGSRP